MNEIRYTEEEQAILAVLEGKSREEIISILQNSIFDEEDAYSRRVLTALLSKVEREKSAPEG